MESNYVSILNMDSEFLHITSAEYISGYLLKLTFSNGDVRMFDFSRIYNKGIFVKLQNPEYFRNFTLDGGLVDPAGFRKAVDDLEKFAESFSK